MKNFGFALVLTLLAGAVLLPALALAQSSTPPIGGNSSSGITFPYWGPILSCSGDYADPSKVHCTSVCDIIKTTSQGTAFATSLLVFIAAPILFLIGGGILLVSAGSPEMITLGRRFLTGTAVGILLVLLSWVIVASILFLIANPATGGVSWPDIVCDPANVPGTIINPGNFDTTPAPPAAGSGNTGGLCGASCQPPKVCSIQNSQPVCIDPVPPPGSPPPPAGSPPAPVSNCNGGQGCSSGNVCVQGGGTYHCQQSSNSCRGLPGGRQGCPTGKVCVSGVGGSVCVDSGGP